MSLHTFSLSSKNAKFKKKSEKSPTSPCLQLQFLGSLTIEAAFSLSLFLFSIIILIEVSVSVRQWKRMPESYAWKNIWSITA